MSNWIRAFRHLGVWFAWNEDEHGHPLIISAGLTREAAEDRTQAKMDRVVSSGHRPGCNCWSCQHGVVR